MTIYIDADACPQAIKPFIFKLAKRKRIPTVQVANTFIQNPHNNSYVSSVQVSQGADVADTRIVELIKENELCITSDIPLAKRIIEKDAFAMSPKGQLFTEANIGQRLSMRNFMTDLRDMGIQTGGPKPFSDRDKQNFSNALDRFVNKYSEA